MGFHFNFIAKWRRTPVRIAASMAAARRRGVGAYVHELHFPPESNASADGILESIVQWCKETVGETRRPCGIGEFDLVLALRRDDSETHSLSLKHMTPGELYTPAGLVDQLRHFLEMHSVDAIAQVSIALFSWGDAAHAALNSHSSAPQAAFPR